MFQACTADGTTYDITNIVPYVMKFKKHPVTGDPLLLKDVIKLNFHKNSDGEYMCPVLNKVFTEHTHIVAIKPTGNVYCWEVCPCLPSFWAHISSAMKIHVSKLYGIFVPCAGCGGAQHKTKVLERPS